MHYNSIIMGSMRDAAPEYITVDGIRYEIRRNARRKNIALGAKDGSFFIAAPLRASRESLAAIIEENGEELRRKLMSRQAARAQEHRYEEGELFYYRGDQYPLRFAPRDGVYPLKLEDGAFVSFSGLTPEEIRHNFEVWYRLRLREIIQREFPAWCKRIGAAPRRVSLKNAKTLWGSCSSSGGVTFNIRLALVPPPLAEYVMIHELCHMSEMNHSPKFWEHVAKYCPDYAARRKKLKTDGAKYRW